MTTVIISIVISILVIALVFFLLKEQFAKKYSVLPKSANYKDLILAFSRPAVIKSWDTDRTLKLLTLSQGIVIGKMLNNTLLLIGKAKEYNIYIVTNIEIIDKEKEIFLFTYKYIGGEYNPINVKREIKL